MDNIQIIPVVTEKANAITEKSNRYTFKVSPEANKYQIKDAVEKLYDVKVVGVSTMNYGGKNKQRYTKSGIIKGKTVAFKKAIVTVAEGQTIDFYSNL
jgi:large subunit ribosomal protein L23